MAAMISLKVLSESDQVSFIFIDYLRALPVVFCTPLKLSNTMDAIRAARGTVDEDEIMRKAFVEDITVWLTKISLGVKHTCG